MRDQGPSEADAAGFPDDDAEPELESDAEPEPESEPDAEPEPDPAPELAEDDVLPESADDVSPDFDSVDPSLPSRSFVRAELAVARRSFLAHPEPLNTTADATIPLRSVPSPPHSGQNVGAESWIPCRISVRWPHAEQTYS